jgi:hypothetical protein
MCLVRTHGNKFFIRGQRQIKNVKKIKSPSLFIDYVKEFGGVPKSDVLTPILKLLKNLWS